MVAEMTTAVSVETYPGFAKNTALLDPPAIGTEDGTGMSGLLLVTAADKPPLGAGPVRPMAQVTCPGGVSRPGVQLRPPIVVRERSDKGAVALAPPALAERVNFWVEPTVVVVTMKLLLVAPWGTVTEAGTEALALPPERVTTVPPVRAPTDSETVHTICTPPVTVPGLHASAETTGKAVRVKAALCEVPLALAVTCTVLLTKTAEATALKLALVEPAATGTEAGTVNAELSLLTATVRPLPGAGAVRVTVHAAVAGVVSVTGVQTSPATFCTTVWMMPSVVGLTKTPMADPPADAPSALLRKTCDEAAVVDAET
jgi:hypothetical protein